ncbi:hypothetical protein BX600DRAFT_441832 [Xylariales sp. PMI_506]|nr:hypothetical protein BX600DRAFT_441832 [Xylariales sp. PMI_506]
MAASLYQLITCERNLRRAPSSPYATKLPDGVLSGIVCCTAAPAMVASLLLEFGPLKRASESFLRMSSQLGSARTRGLMRKQSIKHWIGVVGREQPRLSATSADRIVRQGHKRAQRVLRSRLCRSVGLGFPPIIRNLSRCVVNM